jgi:hypothetical protein
MTLEHRIAEAMRDIAETSGATLVSPLIESTVLLESGIDSLGFAILVARLEDELGYDPFTMMADPIYPRTFGEFVAIYRKFG